MVKHLTRCWMKMFDRLALSMSFSSSLIDRANICKLITS